MERSTEVITVQGSTLPEQDLLTRARNTNPAFGRILDEQIGPLLELMAKKSLDYGDGAENLGLAGQFSDMNRKFTKLRRGMWDGIELAGPEKLSEVLMDMIGHCLLSLDMLAHEDDCEVNVNADELRSALAQLVNVVLHQKGYDDLVKAMDRANEVLAR